MLSKKKKIYVVIKGYYPSELEQVTRTVVQKLNEFTIGFSGPIPLPVKKKSFTVLQSPHVNKKSRQVFGVDTRSRLLVVPASANALSALRGISNTNKGVFIETRYDEKEGKI